MIYEVEEIKQSHERWPITVNMEKRVPEGVRITLVEGQGFLVGRPKILREEDVSNLTKIQLMKISDSVKKGAELDVVGYDKVQLLVTEDVEIVDNTIFDPTHLIIESVDARSFEIPIQDGIPGGKYEIRLNVITDRYDGASQEEQPLSDVTIKFENALT